MYKYFTIPFHNKEGGNKKNLGAPDTGWNRSCVWAPSLHFLDGRWYIYYAAGESGPPYIHQKTGVLQSATEDPMGPYRDMECSIQAIIPI
jgi:GH43 family beta-xylosidase